MNGRTPIVAIIILNWNGLKDTLDCLESIRGLATGNYRVVVVDNGSADNSAAVLKNRYPDITVVELERNLGYTGGNNVGIRHALGLGAHYFWLLNNDTIVFPDSLARLLDVAERSPALGLLSPSVHYYDQPERVQYRGCLIDWKNHRLVIPDSPEGAEVRSNGEPCPESQFGTALLIKREVVEKVGLLREDLFAYWEDVEYCVRAYRKGGYRNSTVTDAKILHKCPVPEAMKERKSPAYYFFMTRNKYFFWMEYLRGKERVRFLRKYVAEAIGDAAGLHYNGADERRDACLDGMWSAFTGVRGAWDKNRRMPAFIRKFLLWHPYFLARALTPQQ